MKARRKRKMPSYIHDKFEWRVTARIRNALLIKRLRRLGTNEAINLAVILENCAAPEQPDCSNGACHTCLRMQRLQYLEEIGAYILRSAHTESMTIVPTSFVVPRGELYRVDLIKVKKWIARGLRDVLPDHLVAIGGVDVSINSKSNADFEWVVHFHVEVLTLAEGVAAKELRARIMARLKLAPVNTSLHIKEVKVGDEHKLASYCLKSIFNWRSTYWKFKNLRLRAPHWAMRKNAPMWKDEVELRLWLSRCAFADRLILSGVTNPAAPNAIRLRDTPRTPKPSEPMKAEKPAKPRATRSTRVKLGRPR
jgi:hypothetical protein